MRRRGGDAQGQTGLSRSEGEAAAGRGACMVVGNAVIGELTGLEDGRSK